MRSLNGPLGSRVFVALAATALNGCADRGAPSFTLVGAYFPAWMVCAIFGAVAAVIARAGFVASGLASILPFQLFVCTSIGVCIALLVWMYWFGQ